MFLLYSRAIKSGGAVIKSTASGGSTTATSSSGGGSTLTSSSGGGTSTTSGFSAPTFFLYTSTHLPNQTYDPHTHAVEVTDELNHNHTVSIQSHSHSVTENIVQNYVAFGNHFQNFVTDLSEFYPENADYFLKLSEAANALANNHPADAAAKLKEAQTLRAK